MVLELASLEKKKKERKKERKRRFSIFSEFVFSACIKLSGNQRTYLYSGGSGLFIDIHFVDIELSYDVFSPLPIVLSKHFNHPHPYIEITTVISDTPYKAHQKNNTTSNIQWITHKNRNIKHNKPLSSLI